MLLVIDNYDSFTYNLVQYLGEAGAQPHVIRNDEVSVDEIEEKLRPAHILISPGPGAPDDAGISLDTIARFAGKVPILGVCLGHQAIGQHFGDRGACRARTRENSNGISQWQGYFRRRAIAFIAGRYHSLVVDRASMPAELVISAESPDGLVMGLRHAELEIHGVQFHPESILTEHGKKDAAKLYAALRS